MTASSECFALEVEKLFAPGELIAGHADLESECTQCHVRLRDTTQKKLCRDCHEEIDVDIRDKTGFHGKKAKARDGDCKSCHGDHKGRKARVVWLDEDSFDHSFTDFRLTGKHELAGCGTCHEADSKHREAKHECKDCHSEDDAHDDKLGSKCGSCHVTSGWNKSEFDHGKTKFELRLSHKQVSCNACHLRGTYEDTPKLCADCHAIRDIHANRFGDQCETCHNEQAWDESTFDHSRDTEYRITGRHRDISCNVCHETDYRTGKKPNPVRACYACHREDDVHDGSNGKKCRDCHSPAGWRKSSFDHATSTDFPLNGGHENLACAACHAAGDDSEKTDTACHNCHQGDDVHANELGDDCGLCHNDVSWQHRVRFDHDLGSFPLIGQHAVLGCEACHDSSTYRDTGNKCIDCHRADDIHKQRFGENCAICHNPNAWMIWRFDHDETDFKLTDAHAHSDVHCHKCHDKPLDRDAGRDRSCINCHRRDDIHNGNFGSRCDKCHNLKNFESPKINR